MTINNKIVTNSSITPFMFFWLYPILIWLSIFPTSLIFMIFFQLFSLFIPTFLIIWFLPVSIVLYYGMFILFLLLFSKLCLIILNLIHKPKEGLFEKSFKNNDYFFFILRKSIKELTLKIYNYFPLPWAKLLALRSLDIKVSYNNGVLDSYIDSDFITIGKNVILGEGSVIMSSMIVDEYLLIKRVILKDGCTIGALSVISPGTIVENGAILGMGSYTKINQCIEEKSIYIGRPAKKLSEIRNNMGSNQK